MCCDGVERSCSWRAAPKENLGDPPNEGGGGVLAM